MLSSCYFNGEGVPKDIDTAIELVGKAAESGNLQCQLDLVRYYTSGEFHEPDLEAARHFAELAAAAGHSEVLAALVQAIHAEKADAKQR